MANQDFLEKLLEALDDKGSKPKRVLKTLLIIINTEIKTSPECLIFKSGSNQQFETESGVKVHMTNCDKCQLLMLLADIGEETAVKDKLKVIRTYIENELEK